MSLRINMTPARLHPLSFILCCKGTLLFPKCTQAALDGRTENRRTLPKRLCCIVQLNSVTRAESKRDDSMRDVSKKEATHWSRQATLEQSPLTQLAAHRKNSRAWMRHSYSGQMRVTHQGRAAGAIPRHS